MHRQVKIIELFIKTKFLFAKFILLYKKFLHTMNRIDRLMGMVTLIQSRKQVQVEDIAAHYNISVRTVFRDLRALVEMGIPVQFEAEQGYSVAPGFFLPPVSLTIEEVNALSFAEPLIIRFADLSIKTHYASALAKIKMVLGRNQQAQLEQTREQTAHFIPDHYAHLMPSSDHLMILQNAISEQRVVRISYQNAEGEISKREAEPIGLIFYSLNWHLIAWCHLRKEYRDFRTSRIEKLAVGLEPFRKKDHLSLSEYLANAQHEILQNARHPLT
jgi:predicted DNA-binding transcriptional regulator YafY